MSLNKETGIVLFSRNFPNADSIVTLLGSTKSKTKYALKGIKKSKNRPIVSSEIGSLIAIDYYDHEKDGVKMIKEVNILNRFDAIKSSYGGFLILSYTAELLDKILPDGESYPKIFKLYFEFLTSLNSNEYSPLVLPFFKVKLLAQIGLFSGEFICHFCGQEVLEKKSVFVNPENWEVVCGDCQHVSKNYKTEVSLLSAMMKAKYKNLKSVEIPVSVIKEADSLLNIFLKYYLGASLKTADTFYKSISENYEFHC